MKALRICEFDALIERRKRDYYYSSHELCV